MSLSLSLESPEATDRLARRIAPHLRAGDMLGLSGPLGVGKSHLARALIRARLGREEEPVPSPSYTLVQIYDLGAVALWHADLYRLGGVEELGELGLEEAFASAITLVEWPERLGALAPARRLDIALDFAGEGEARRAVVTPRGGGWDRVAAALGQPVAAS